jgi:poly(A) polymerase
MATNEPPPTVIPRQEHCISRNHIDPQALKILYRLRHHGFRAYLVGGGVRDLLLGRRPKDFDVGTDARPGQVRKLFRNSQLIGRRFRLVHIRFRGQKVIEVATFRRIPSPEEVERFGAENTFGTPRQDALRRDFTVNALFYNIADFTVIDHVDGLSDMKSRTIRVVGDPDVRFLEDPVRMLRALEFSARLDFSLDEAAATALRRHAAAINNSSRMRMKEEILNLFRLGVSEPVFRKAHNLGLLEHITPGIIPDAVLWPLLDALDTQAREGRSTDLFFLLATIHLPTLLKARAWSLGGSLSDTEDAIQEILKPFTDHYQIGAHVRHLTRELLLAFWRMGRGKGHRGDVRFRSRPVFQDALSLLRIWIQATGRDENVLASWDEKPPKDPSKPKKRRRRRRKRKTTEQTLVPATNEFPDTSASGAQP